MIIVLGSLLRICFRKSTTCLHFLDDGNLLHQERGKPGTCFDSLYVERRLHRFTEGIVASVYGRDSEQARIATLG